MSDNEKNVPEQDAAAPQDQPEAVEEKLDPKELQEIFSKIFGESAKKTTIRETLVSEHDKYLRLYAEYENYRKRTQKEREALYAQVKSDVVISFLPVYDNLERALKTGCGDEAFLKGIKMTMSQLEEVLSKLGVKPIEAVGRKFDANLHNAVMHIDDDSRGEGEIVEEFQKGFTLGDKVIRFSMVKVAN